MKKIESLTKEQELLIPVYREKWLKIGLSTERNNRSLCEKYASEFYESCGFQKPKYFFHTSSPFMALMFQLALSNLSQLDGQLRDQLGDQLGGQLRGQLDGQLRDQLDGQLRDQLRGQLWDQLRGQLDGQLRGQLWDQLRGQLNYQLSKFFFGRNAAYWISYYDYIQDVLLPNNANRLIPFKELSKNCFWFLTYKEAIIFSEPPISMLFNDDKLLHCENGPAIKFSDGYYLYALNGVRMSGSEWVITTPKEDINPENIMAIKNVEQRLQAIKHVGPEKMLTKLNAEVIDSKNDYELMLLDIEGQKCEFLKMVNPTTGEIHIEGIGPGIKTVNQAMAWRMGLKVYSNPAFTA